MRKWFRALVYKLWVPIIVTDEAGQVFHSDIPLLRRVAEAVRRHWIAHWKFWLPFVASVIVMVVTVLKYVGGGP